MKHTTTALVVFGATFALLGTARVALADPAALCLAKKEKAAARAAEKSIKCIAHAISNMVPVDETCLSKESDHLAATFAKIEAAGGCLHVGDVPALQALIVTFLDQLGDALPQGGNRLQIEPPARDDCAGAKMRASAEKVGGKLKCYAAARGVGTSVDPSCLSRQDQKMARHFARVESKGGCFATGDEPAIESMVDGFVSNVDDLLANGVTATPSPMCDNPHAITDSVVECLHYIEEEPVEMPPCHTDMCILDLLDSATCDFHGGSGPSQCDVSLTNGPEVIQELRTESCTTSDTGAYHTWHQLYRGCTTKECFSDPPGGWQIHCVADTQSCTGTLVARFNRGEKKQVGCP